MEYKNIGEIRYKNRIYQIFLKKPFKAKRYIRFRYKNGDIYITGPIFVSIKDCYAYLEKNLKSIVKDDYLHGGTIKIFDKYYGVIDGAIDFKNKTIKIDENFYKNIGPLVKEELNERLRIIEDLMGLEKHSLTIRYMTTRYGVNSVSRKRITLTSFLIHYDYDIIDSVIIHELAHDRIHNHGQNFYNEVLKYCPNYYELDKKLKKGIYKND